jgi:hypothetical protein
MVNGNEAINFIICSTDSSTFSSAQDDNLTTTKTMMQFNFEIHEM